MRICGEEIFSFILEENFDSSSYVLSTRTTYRVAQSLYSLSVAPVPVCEYTYLPARLLPVTLAFL